MKPYNLILRRSAIWFSRCGICPLWRAGFGIESMHGMRDAENMYRDLAGLRENLVRDDGIGKPYRGSSSRSFAATHSLPYSFIRKLKQRRQRRQREWQKSNRFRLTKQHLCTCITLFFFAVVTQLRRRIRLGFHGGRQHKFKTTALFFFSWTLIQFFRIQLQKQIHQHLTNCMTWNKSDFKV